MKYKIIPTSLIVACLFFTAILLAHASFSDTQGNKYQTAIEFIQSRNIVSGYPDGTFRPNNMINRAELLTIIVGQKYKSLKPKNCFNDVFASAWYSKFVCKGQQLGIVSGYPNGSFKPDQNVNFVEALIMLQRAHNILVDTSISPWFTDSVNKASTINIIPLDVTNFDQKLTRGQMAEMMTRILKYQENTLDAYLGTKKDYNVTFNDIQANSSIEYKWKQCQAGNISYCRENVLVTPTVSSWPISLELHRWQDVGTTESFNVGVGDKLPISNQLNIRIESITEARYRGFNGSQVNFSIWGKDNNNICRFISNTGALYYPNNEDFRSSREFTDAFIELTSVADGKATIKKYTGALAGQRCNEIMSSNRRPIACSFYPDSNSYYVENEHFRVHFREQSYQWNAELTAQSLDQCLGVMRSTLPILESITPYKLRWGTYAITPDVPSGYSADYERISTPYSLPPSKNSFTDKDLTILNDGKCPIKLDAFPHELTHLLFNNTALQRGYDAGARTLPSDISPDSIDLAEGHATYFPYFIIRNNAEDSASYLPLQLECGKDGFIRENLSSVFDEATDEQLKYANILKGKGFKSSYYEAGFCFFDRVQKDCGDNTIKDIFTQILNNMGNITKNKTMFSYMGETCNHDTVKEIMNDFGFDLSLAAGAQQYPQSFQSGKTDYGCF